MPTRKSCSCSYTRALTHKHTRPSTIKTDGTRAFYFTTEDVAEIMCDRDTGAGLETEELHYIRRQYANRADKVARYRVWVHGKFRRPQCPLVGDSNG